MGITKSSALSRNLALRVALLLTGVSLALAACSTGDAPGHDYSTGTVQIREFKVRTGEFTALFHAESEPARVGSGNLTNDGRFTWNLNTPAQTALVNASDLFGEGVTVQPADLRIALAHEFYDESTDSNIEQAVIYGTSSGLHAYEQGTRIGLLVYADRDATVEFATEYEKGTVGLTRGWNVLAGEIVGVDSDDIAHTRYQTGSIADLYFYHHYRDWSQRQ